MKTKAIIILLLAFLLSVRTSAAQCICPSEVESATALRSNRVERTAGQAIDEANDVSRLGQRAVVHSNDVARLVQQAIEQANGVARLGPRAIEQANDVARLGQRAVGQANVAARLGHQTLDQRNDVSRLARQAVVQTSVAALSVDVCRDCGHKKDCCIKQAELRARAASSASLQIPPPTGSAEPSPLAVLFIASSSQSALSAVDNKAPPWSELSLVALQRKILI